MREKNILPWCNLNYVRNVIEHRSIECINLNFMLKHIPSPDPILVGACTRKKELKFSWETSINLDVSELNLT